MRREIMKLGSETAVYGLSTVLGRLLNFLLLPFYTHYLDPADFGLAATVFSLMAFLNVVYQRGMDQAYLREAAEPKADLQRIFSTAFWSVFASALALSGLILLATGAFNAAAGLADQGPFIALCCAGTLALDALAALPLIELRRAHRAWAYAGIKTANIASNVAMNLLFVASWSWGLDGIFAASLGSAALTLLLACPVLLRRLEPVLDASLHRSMIAFANPLIPAGLAAMATQVIDRPILQRLTDNATVGLYQANYRLGIFMMLLVGMFDMAWRPFFMERGHKSGAPELFGRVMSYFAMGSAFLGLGVTLFIEDLVAIPIMGKPLIHPDYWTGLSIVPVVLAAYWLNGLYVNFLAPVSIAKKTSLIAGATWLGAVINVLANLALIPRFGMMGAAWATLLAYGAMALQLWRSGRKFYRVPYEWVFLARIALAAVFIAALGKVAPVLCQGTSLLGAKAMLLAGFAMLVIWKSPVSHH